MTGAWPAQEVRRAPRAMIASVNPLASAAGLQVLREGGNAVDAAVAAGAVLTVVEPLSGQLGGDAFLLIRPGSSDQITAINGSGAAPALATLGRYREAGGIPETGWLAASVPGVVDAWQVALERFGSRPLAPLLEPAARYAEAGFPVTARQARNIAQMATEAARFPDTAAVYFPDGSAVEAGARLRQTDLARTLRTLQREGARSFYQGPIAEAIVRASERGGGLFSLKDFADHRTVVQEPIQVSYRGWNVVEQPPVSQGIVVLIALGILQQFDLAHASPADSIHLQVEAHKLALGERVAHLGDPRFARFSIQELLSVERSRRLAQRLDRRRAAAAVETQLVGHPDTTYLCVVDEQRTAVSYIHSLYGGNGVVAGDTGVLLNNRMGCFSLDEASPNCLAPGKRPMHTLNAWMLSQGRDLRYVGGTPGSFWQVQTNLQIITRLIDFKDDLRSAVDHPRWTMGSQTGWEDTSLNLEARAGDDVLAELGARGHRIQRIGDWEAGGAVQAIGIDGDGLLLGAGDPRPKTSAVLGY